MLRGGWIKLWRKLEDSQVFQNEGLLKVFIWCLERASSESRFAKLKVGKGFTEVKLEAGQFIYGRNKSAKALKMPPETLRTRLNKLQRLGMLTKANTSKDTNQTPQ